MTFGDDPGRILILGAGPTGLGAGYRLQELGFDDFTVLEAEKYPGGLASSHRDDHGFTWDVGGHVQFSHYAYYDRVLDRVLDGQWVWHDRRAWIRIKNRFIPYPFQNNIHRLDTDDRLDALRGLEQAEAARSARPAPADFAEWIEATFGDGMARLFMSPYNQKVWGYPLERLGVAWVGERVAIPDVDRIRQNILEDRDDVDWGPNNRFRFPSAGGTGAIWCGVARAIRPERLAFGHRVVGIDVRARIANLADGRRLRYDTLITSIPLDVLGAMCDGLSTPARRSAADLVYSSVHILGIGLKGGQPDGMATKSWMYFPEAHSPYYRVTVFSNYSAALVPPGPEYWSVMAEACESPHRRFEGTALKEWTLRALRQDEVVPREAEVISVWHQRVEHGYPTPFLRRDEALNSILPELERCRVYSRGRFGGWKYEASNQDHSFMQGVELVDSLLTGRPETTFPRPAVANSGVFLRDGQQ